MKRRLTMCGALFVVLTSALCLPRYASARAGQDAAPAQQANPISPQPATPQARQGGPGHGQMSNVNDRVERLTKELNLTDDQQKQVRSIFEDQQSQAMQIKKGGQSMDPAERRQKMMAIRDATTEKIKALLNDTQKKQYDQMLQQQHQNMQEHREGPAPN